MVLEYQHSFIVFHIVLFLGSGDMDGMNKVNIVSTLRVFAF